MSTIEAGEILRDEGMERAINNAEQHTIGWKTQALDVLINHFPCNQQFMVEDLRKFAYDMGLPKPPSERAWGSVISSAKRDGLVEHRGFSSVKNPKAHKTPASVWVKIEI